VSHSVAQEPEQGHFPSRASKSISLILIGSSLLLAGCGGSTNRCEEDPNLPKDKQKNCAGSRSHYYGGSRSHVYVGSGAGGGGYRTGTGVSSSPRGGFGAMGHAATGG
jgi:hypothetical protein